MAKRYDTILSTIGNVLVVRINKLVPAHVNLFMKVESFNPMGHQRSSGDGGDRKMMRDSRLPSYCV